MELSDFSRKPYEITAILEDGTARRNDGVHLKAANAQAWYALATSHGEQSGVDFDDELHLRNRDSWNSTMLSKISDKEREHLIKSYGPIPPLEKKPLSTQELEELEARVSQRIPNFSINHLFHDKCVDLSRTLFSDHLCLDGFIFLKPLCFSRSHVRGMLRVDNSYILCPSDFKGAVMYGNTYFRFSKFVGKTSFHSSQFESTVSFRGSTFYNEVEFFHGVFKDRAYFESVNFFSNCDTAVAPKFNDTCFNLAVSFRKSHFRDAVPNMREALFPESVEFTPEDDLWPTDKKSYDDTSRQTFSALSHAMDRRGFKDHAHFFFRKEMRCRSNSSKGLDRVALFFYQTLSDFGFSVSRPIWGLFWIVLTGTVLFFFHFLDKSCLESSSHKPLECASILFSGASKAGSLSFSNTLSFLGFQRIFFGSDEIRLLPAPYQILTGAQSILGIVMLFFLGLGLRNRFRLK